LVVVIVMINCSPFQSFDMSKSYYNMLVFLAKMHEHRNIFEYTSARNSLCRMGECPSSLLITNHIYEMCSLGPGQRVMML